MKKMSLQINQDFLTFLYIPFNIASTQAGVALYHKRKGFVMQKFTQVDSAVHSYKTYHFLKNRKTLWCMLRDVWHGKYHMSLSTVVLLILGVVYIISPLDFDWLPFVGWIDDVAVLVLLIKLLQRETKRYIRAKVMERRGEH